MKLHRIARGIAHARGNLSVVANDNCPGRIVISGDRAAVERAVELAAERGARSCCRSARRSIVR
jgi:malonyl CoA-acyl carrier protein transacylase